MEFTYSKRLEPLLTSLETTLMAMVPKAVRGLNIQEPVYALFIWYHDSATTDVCPQFGLGTESVLQRCQRNYPSSEESRFACIWSPQQTLSELSIPVVSIAHPELKKNFQEAYSLMLSANKTGLPLPDEGEILKPFRVMIRRLAVRLNDIDWSNDLNVDESFVVVATDFVGVWLEEDLRVCIPKRKLALLEEKGIWL